MAAALSWEAASGAPSEVGELLGDPVELLLAIPEHKVALPGGRRESQCDVFALVKHNDATTAVAVEAKVNEPFGPTVREWLVEASDGKIERMRFICDLLGLNDTPPEHLHYQLFHRTAAAIIEAERFKTDRAAMIVHSFSQEHRWFEDFQAFADYLGLRAEPGRAMTRALPSGRPLILGWAVGSAEFLQPLSWSATGQALVSRRGVAWGGLNGCLPGLGPSREPAGNCLTAKARIRLCNWSPDQAGGSFAGASEPPKEGLVRAHEAWHQ